MRHEFAAHGDLGAGLRISTHPRCAINQRETAKTPDFDALSSCQRLTHRVDDFLYNEVGIGWRELRETGRQSVDQFRTEHLTDFSGGRHPLSALTRRYPNDLRRLPIDPDQ
jgi:hypothetical protein